MSNQCISSKQREHYTQYLQAQIQKFSCFMLSQKKENETCRNMQAAIEKQNQHIDVLTNKIKVLESYQRENFQHCSKLENSTFRTIEFEQRLRKIEIMCAWNQQKCSTKQNKMKLSNLSGQISESATIEIWQEFDALKTEVLNRIQRIESVTHVIQERSAKRNSQLNTDHSDLYSTHTNTCLPTEILATKKQLRNSEQKLYEIFNKKFSKLQRMVRKAANIDNSSRPSQAPSTMGTQQHASHTINQQQTFGPNENQYNDYNLAHDKSSNFSENSIRLKPILYFPNGSSPKQTEKHKRHKKQRSKRSHNKSLSKSKSKSKSENSKSVTHSRSKSTKRNKQGIVRNQSKKSANHYGKCEYGVPQYINEYKKMCNKKHD